MLRGSDVTSCKQDNADAEMQGRPSSLKDLKEIPSVWSYFGNCKLLIAARYEGNRRKMSNSSTLQHG